MVVACHFKYPIGGVPVKKCFDILRMVLLMVIGMIPLIADVGHDKPEDGVIVVADFNLTADAAGSALSISGNLPSITATSNWSNRIIVVVLHYEVPSGTGAIVNDVTIGGVPATAVGPEMTVLQRVWAGYIYESQIASFTDPMAVVANFSSAPTYAQVRVAVLAHVDQTQPIASVVSNGSDTAAQDIDFGSTPLVVPAKGMGFYFLNSAEIATNTQTPPQPFSKTFEALANFDFDAGGGEFFSLSDVSVSGAGMKLANAVRYGVLAFSVNYD
jgi:hypothetical protein